MPGYNTIEDPVSVNNYLLNRELIYYKSLYEKATTKKVSLKSAKRFVQYLMLGAFQRIIYRMKTGVSSSNSDDYPLKQYQTFPKKKVAVYTCIWGPYDDALEPYYVNDSVDYFIITDQDIPASSVWRKYDIASLIDIDGLSGTEVNRFCKMFPHKLFPEYDYSIYIDGNVRIVTDVMPIVADVGDHLIGIHRYPFDCIYEMKNAVIVGNKAPKQAVYEQINAYKQEGFPEHFGAFECNVIVRQHNDKACIRIMESWWDEFNRTASKRDQLSFVFVLWKLGYKSDVVYSLGDNVRFNPRFQIIQHRENQM